jgi:hypothetical protein
MKHNQAYSESVISITDNLFSQVHEVIIIASLHFRLEIHSRKPQKIKITRNLYIIALFVNDEQGIHVNQPP